VVPTTKPEQPVNKTRETQNHGTVHPGLVGSQTRHLTSQTRHLKHETRQ